MADNLASFRNDKHRMGWRKAMEGTYLRRPLKVAQLELAHKAAKLPGIALDYWARFEERRGAKELAGQFSALSAVGDLADAVRQLPDPAGLR